MAQADFSTIKIGVEYTETKDTAKSLRAIASALKRLDDVASSLQSIKVVTSSLNELSMVSLDNLASGLSSFVNSLGQLNSVGASNITQQLNDMGDTTKKITDSFMKMSNVVVSSTNSINTALNGMADNTKQATEKVKKTTNKFGKSFKKVLDKTIGQFNKSIVRIGFYRIIRAIMSAIQKAIGEGFNSIVLYSDKVNNALSNIRANAKQFYNQFGAVAGNFIVAFEPTIVELQDLLLNLTDTLSQFFAVMSGDTTYAKATKNVEDYRASLQSLKTVGIDELNVLSETKQTGLYTDEDISLSQEMVDSAQELKDNIYNIFETLKPIIELLFRVVEKLLPAINKLLNMIIRLVDKLVPIIEPIADFVVNVVNILVDILSPIINKIVSQLEKLKPIFNNLFNNIAVRITNSLTTINKIQIFTERLEQFLVKLVHKSEILTAIFDGWKEIFEFYGNAVQKIFNFIYGLHEKVNNWFGNLTDFLFPKYANGGFVNSGELFIARESGAELVGSMSGRTAVANNDQIVEGIYRGVLQAMNDSNAGGTNVVVYLDSNEINDTIVKKQKQVGIGNSLYKGGSLNGI